MFRTLILLIIFIAGLFGLYWLDIDNGVISIQALGYQVDARVSVFIVLIFLVAFLLYIILNLLEKIISLPSSMKNMLGKHQEKTNYNKIIESCLLLIKNHKRDAGKILTALKSKNDINLLTLKELGGYLANTSYEKLLNMEVLSKTIEEFKQSILIAHHSDSITDEQVVMYFKEFPSEQSAKDVMLYYLKKNNYKQLHSFFNKYSYKVQLPDKIALDLSLIISALYAQQLVDAGNFYEAISVLNKSENSTHKLYILVLAFIKLKDYQSAVRELKNNWRKYQSDETAILCMDLLEFLKPEKFFNLAQSIATEDQSSYILMAIASLAVDKFDLAAEYISKLLDEKNKLTGAILMAEFCEKTQSGKMETVNWLRKALIEAPAYMHLSHIQKTNILFLEKLLDS